MSDAAPIVVLLSIARHPVSGRRVASPLDRAALELALRLGGSVRGLHAGDAAEPALRDFLRMGLCDVDVVPVTPSSDVAPQLASHLARLGPSLILAGARAGLGRASGMLPYVLARRFGLPVVAGMRGIAPDKPGWIAELVVGPGRSRRVGLPGACVGIVDERSVTPRYGSFVAGQRGRINTVFISDAAPERPGPQYVAARRRPAPIEPPRGKTAAERLELISGGGRPLRSGHVSMSPAEASRAILDVLRARELGPFAKGSGGGER